MTVTIAYVGWLGDDLIEVPGCVDVIFIRLLAPIFVHAHLKVLKRWQHHVHNKQSKSSAHVKVNTEQPYDHCDAETTFTTCQHASRSQSIYDNVSKDSDLGKQTLEDRVDGQGRKQTATPLVFARSVSHAEETVDACDDDCGSLIRAHWALVALVIDKLCFVLFFAAIVTCISYYSVIGYQAWSSFALA